MYITQTLKTDVSRQTKKLYHGYVTRANHAILTYISTLFYGAARLRGFKEMASLLEKDQET